MKTLNAVKTSTGTGTSAPTSPVAGPTEEELKRAAEFKLDPYLVRLLIDEPFFSTILRLTTKVRTSDLPTAGVTVKGDVFTLYWNPLFTSSLKKKQVKGLMKHECYHLILKHCTSRKQDPHLLWNIATDLAINSIIPRDELPDGGLYPGEALDLSKCVDPVAKAQWQKVSDLIESFPKNKSSEWYMERLLEDEEIRKIIEEGNGGDFVIDDHDGWGDLTDEERQVAEGKLRQHLRDAVKRADSSGQWGSVTGEMREELRQMVSDRIDWKRIIQNFVGNSQRANKARTHRRVNRKYPYIHPGVRRGHSAAVAVYMDQSGSVGDDNIELLFACLNQLGRKVSFTLFPFDYSVNDEAAIKWRKGDKAPPIRTNCGGTNFHAVEKHIQDHSGEFDGHIILTDGEASDPGPSRKRRCWVIVPGRKLMFEPHASDIVVEMEGEPGM